MEPPETFSPSFLLSNLHLRETGQSRCARIAPHTLNAIATSNDGLYQRDVKGHTGCVNSVEFSTSEKWVASGGDDLRVVVWSVSDFQVNPNPQPIGVMDSRHTSNIFTIAFSKDDDRIYSGGNDCHFLIHDLLTTKRVRVHRLPGAINFIETNPVDDQIVLTASDDGNIRLFDMRDQSSAGSIVVEREEAGTAYCAKFNPYQSNLIAVCSQDDNVGMFDVRKSDEPCCPTFPELESVMFVDWTELGDAFVGIRSQMKPFYYNILNGTFAEFKSANYRNTHTMKSCSYLKPGYLVTGSDNWDIFMWKVPKPSDIEKKDKKDKNVVCSEYGVLKGSRSIVNHVRFSHNNDMIISCGVEKIIKCWSAYGLAGAYRNPQRRRVLRQSEAPLEPADSFEEDLNMLAMFDNLGNRRYALEIFSDSSDDDDDVSIQSEISDLTSSSSS